MFWSENLCQLLWSQLYVSLVYIKKSKWICWIWNLSLQRSVISFSDLTLSPGSFSGCTVGASCTTDLCTQFNSCSDCSLNADCKWCGNDKKCQSSSSWKCMTGAQCFPNTECVRTEPEWIGYAPAPTQVSIQYISCLLCYRWNLYHLYLCSLSLQSLLFQSQCVDDLLLKFLKLHNLWPVILEVPWV